MIFLRCSLTNVDSKHHIRDSQISHSLYSWTVNFVLDNTYDVRHIIWKLSLHDESDLFNGEVSTMTKCGQQLHHLRQQIAQRV